LAGDWRTRANRCFSRARRLGFPLP
jgi:hypothetical protein